MIQTATVPINDKELEAISIQTETSFILVIKAKKGFLGCGYFNVETANKLDESAAIVTDVKTFDDMLNAKITQVSNKAKELGIAEGMTGKEALGKMM
jgi:uncharacterized protein YunC (DUF1805 family)|tara:strand:- start:224 stop:514 length:291 start_codon:yes stop_codon:yes gene_type:complete